MTISGREQTRREKSLEGGREVDATVQAPSFRQNMGGSDGGDIKVNLYPSRKKADTGM